MTAPRYELEPDLVPIIAHWDALQASGKNPYRTLYQLLGADAPAKRAIHAMRDEVIPGPGGPLTVRIYRPSDQPDLPALVALHGGGWTQGGLDGYDINCRDWANDAGCAVVSVAYRLAPAHTFPAAAEDAYAATAWVHANAARLGIDAARIAIQGGSAGGNLAAAAALMARERGGPPLVLQLLLYPALDADADFPSRAYSGPGLTGAAVRRAWATYLGGHDRADPYASPLRATSFAGLPPALVEVGTLDPFHDESAAYVRALTAAGVPARLRSYPGAIHGFYLMRPALASARDGHVQAVAALREAFRKP